MNIRNASQHKIYFTKHKSRRPQHSRSMCFFRISISYNIHYEYFNNVHAHCLMEKLQRSQIGSMLPHRQSLIGWRMKAELRCIETIKYAHKPSLKPAAKWTFEPLKQLPFAIIAKSKTFLTLTLSFHRFDVRWKCVEIINCISFSSFRWNNHKTIQFYWMYANAHQNSWHKRSSAKDCVEN